MNTARLLRSAYARPSRLSGRSPRCSSGRSSGLTVVELVVTMLVLLVAVGGTLGSISSFTVLSDSSWQRSVAYTAAQETIERMQAENFRDVFARYNTDPADDPGANAPGADFDVEGLDVQAGDADGMVGRILFPVDPATPTQLFENLVDDTFGFPRDLNGDGATDAADHADDYFILPVRVRVEWRARSGNRFIELETILRSL